MLRTILLLSLICGLVKSSGVGVSPLQVTGSIAPVGPRIAPVANAPVVTAASSQYFQRTFNRLVVPPVVTSVAPVAPPPLASVLPLPPAPAVYVEPTRTVPVVFNSQPPPSPPPPAPVQPNVAIAVATAHAAAPVATILLPPYPFGFPSSFGFIPSAQPENNPDDNTKEPTTQRTTETEATTTSEPPTTTPIDASGSDNNFVQALPSNENVNFNLYGPPPQGSGPRFQRLPQPQASYGQFQPQLPNPQLQYQSPNLQPQEPYPQFQQKQPNPKFQPQQSNIEFQPLRPNTQLQPQPEFPPYPPHKQPQYQNQNQQWPQLQPRPQYLLPNQQPRKQQKGRPQKLKTSVEVVPVPLAYITPPPLRKTHAHVKVLKHVYAYVPASNSKIVLRPVKIRPIRLVKHKVVGVRLQHIRASDRDIEITTINPFRRPNTKPPRV